MTGAPGSVAAPALRIGLPDIARLARVQRPVVTVWRSRSAAGPNPFPEPIATERGQEWFDCDEVVAWLETTGRGNSDSVRADAAAFAGPPVGENERVTFLALTALLTLLAVSPARLDLADADEILDAADEADPDDEFLYREIEAAGAQLVDLARYAHRLADGAYSARAAFERLLADPSATAFPGRRPTRLSPPALDLLASAALALADDLDIDLPVFVDPTPGGSDLPAVLAQRAEDRVIDVHTRRDDDPADRLTRRRIRVHDLHRAALEPDGAGGYLIPDNAIVVATFPGPAQPSMSDLEVLEAVDAIALETTAANRVLILGPSSALIDRLAGSQERALRGDLLRTDRLRALVGLPPGVAAARPRQRMALWVLGPAQAGRDVQNRPLVGDLANHRLDRGAVDALVTDLVAAMHPPTVGAPNLLRRIASRVLLARTGSLIEPSATAASAASPASGVSTAALRVAESAARAARPIEVYRPPTVEPRAGEDTVAPTGTVAAALTARSLRAVPGHRLHPDHLGTGGAAPVIGPAELADPQTRGARTIEHLTFAAHYPAGAYTGPGDVVFCTAPRPTAWVDPSGGSVVQAPARILRVDGSAAPGLVPRVIADDINALPPTAKSWRGWTVRRVPADQAGALEAALGEIDAYRDELSDRLAEMATLAADLTDGIIAGTLSLAGGVDGASLPLNAMEGP